MDKKSSDQYVPDSSNNSADGGKNGWNSSASDITADEGGTSNSSLDTVFSWRV